MRYLLVLVLATTACTDVPLGGPHYDSVLARLAEVPTSLYVHDEASSGTVTARRRGGDGWIAGSTTLAIEHGYLRAALDDDGRLAIDQLEIAIAPIALDGVFERPAQLQDVRVRLREPVRGDVTWTSVDDASATVDMAFDLDWAITFAGDDPYPLATQHISVDAVAVELGGYGDHVDARLTIDASGELWSWADLVQITDLALSVTAETND